MASVCRAAIKEEETSGEMKVGQDGMGWGGARRARRGGAGQEREAACVQTNPLLRDSTQRVHVQRSPPAPPSPLPRLRQKQTPTRRQSQGVSSVEDETEFGAPGEVRRSANCPPGCHSGQREEKSDILQLRRQIPQTNQWA